MSLHESEAIVLESYPLGEADRLVSFFSRSMGRVRGVAAGARRTKSRFGSALERLSYIRIWFFERETRELVRINQCELIESFLDAFRDYDSSVALALMSEITEKVLPDREPSDANFRLLLSATQAIKCTGRVSLPLAYFCLWSLRLGGWLPELGAIRGLSPAARDAASKILRERLETLSDASIPERTSKELAEHLLDRLERQIERKLESRKLMETRI
ncbi:MAG: DNA repair protein RecO [Candidatus Acidiferrales bacterium]